MGDWRDAPFATWAEYTGRDLEKGQTMNDLISRSELLNRIGRECHYDSEHPLESYAKLLWMVCTMPTVKETQREKEMQDGWKSIWHDEGIGRGGNNEV